MRIRLLTSLLLYRSAGLLWKSSPSSPLTSRQLCMSRLCSTAATTPTATITSTAPSNYGSMSTEDNAAVSKWMETFTTRYFKYNGAKKEYIKLNQGASTGDGIDESSLAANVLQMDSCSSDIPERIKVLSLSRHAVFPDIKHYDVLSIDIAGNDEVVTKLPLQAENSFDVACLSSVLSEMTDPDDRLHLIHKMRHLLRNPGRGGHVHRCGLLFVIEDLAVFPRVDNALLSSWRSIIRDCGFEETRYVTIPVTDRSTAYRILVFLTASTRQQRHATSASKMWTTRDLSTRQKTFESGHKKTLPVAIIGGGLAGTALALDLQRKGIPYVVFEKDVALNARKQGYALTIQQGNSALRQFGISPQQLHEVSVTSQSHVSMAYDGAILGHYSAQHLTDQKELPNKSRVKIAASFDSASFRIVSVPAITSVSASYLEKQGSRRRHNVHLPRQTLREMLFTRDSIQHNYRWGTKVVGLENLDNAEGVRVLLESGETHEASVVVGADGIFSVARDLLGSLSTSNFIAMKRLMQPLNYLGLMVILGISPNLMFCSQDKGATHDSRRRSMQWVDGTARIFTMPFDASHTMWQLSFPIGEKEALDITNMGESLKELALQTVEGWDPALIDMLAHTQINLISGHPAYDRDPVEVDDFLGTARGVESLVTLLGDAAHPMSPFKGQGANQALLDAASLGRCLMTSGLGRTGPILMGRRTIAQSLREFEKDMCERSRSKVLGSRDAAAYLHCEQALARGDITRSAAAQVAAGVLNVDWDNL
jgi:salicylate hydroxylase